MGCGLVCAVYAVLSLQIIAATQLVCPQDPNCLCSSTLDVELSCNIDGHIVNINLLPDIYINIKCENTTDLDYEKLPKCVNDTVNLKTVSFKDCPLPSTSFKDVLTTLGVAKSMALVYQNGRNLSRHFDRKHFAGLQDLKKLLLSITGVTHLPNDLFEDINNLTWLNIRSNGINLSVELFKPLERLETLEISHNHMTNISSNLFSHLSFLRKLSLWQSNVTWFSKDLFAGVDVLEELDLSSNELNELPATIFEPLLRLKKLTLFSNKFSSLPQNLLMNNKRLETVVILNNDVKLKEFPGMMFGNLVMLTQIDIQRCGLEDVPKDAFTNSSLISKISLAYNDIAVLAESVFNDQINLLELDLSHNKLVSLPPKLFSSLVRLEKLNLCFNSIINVQSPTFAPLLSLVYLNMDHNNLTTIGYNLFTNNKQRMYISLAYNRINFVKKLPDSIHSVKLSPFYNIYSMRLLNFSHNELTDIFVDWWNNGHEIVDISHNQIEYLWGCSADYGCIFGPKMYLEMSPHMYISNQHNPCNLYYELECATITNSKVKYVYMSHNPIKCTCCNKIFLYYGLTNTLNQMEVLDSIPCWKWTANFCDPAFRFMIPFLFVGLALMFYKQLLSGLSRMCKKITKNRVANYYYNSGTKISLYFKKISATLFGHAKNKNIRDYRMLVRTCEEDATFFLEVFQPVMESYQLKNFVHEVTAMITNQNDTVKVYVPLTCTKENTKQITIVIFSPNYLTSTYSHVDIKKIHTEMLKADNTIYVFADIGPENSIYAFLKDQRDVTTTVVYNEPNFKDKFICILKQIAETIDNEESKADNDKNKIISESRVSNELKINDLNTPMDSQV